MVRTSICHLGDISLEEGSVAEAIRMMLTRRFDSFGAFTSFGIAATMIIAGIGLLLNAHWAPLLAKIIAFPLSLGWPLGLIVAVETWWVLNPI